ncbi:hypothetical protein Tco_1074532 [Tanacetum coccineum]
MQDPGSPFGFYIPSDPVSPTIFIKRDSNTYEDTCSIPPPHFLHLLPSLPDKRDVMQSLLRGCDEFKWVRLKLRLCATWRGNLLVDVSIVAYDDAITFVIHGLEWLESTRIMAGQHVIVLAAISGSHTLFSRSLASFDDLNYDSATCIVCEAVIMKYVHCSSCGLEELANLTDNEETGILEITHQEGYPIFTCYRSLVIAYAPDPSHNNHENVNNSSNKNNSTSVTCTYNKVRVSLKITAVQIEGQVGAQQIRQLKQKVQNLPHKCELQVQYAHSQPLSLPPPSSMKTVKVAHNRNDLATKGSKDNASNNAKGTSNKHNKTAHTDHF